MVPDMDKEVLRKRIQVIQKKTNEEERLKTFFVPLSEKSAGSE